MKTVTQWFDPEVDPVHVGIYEMEDLPLPFHWWDGLDWWSPSTSPDVSVERLSECVSPVKSSYATFTRWRGLAEKPA